MLAFLEFLLVKESRCHKVAIHSAYVSEPTRCFFVPALQMCKVIEPICFTSSTFTTWKKSQA